MSSDSDKHKKFVAEDIDDKKVTELPGIGDKLGGYLIGKGFSKASTVLGQFLVFNKNEDKFKEWLQEIPGKNMHVNTTQQTNCTNCLKKKCEVLKI